VRDLCSDYIGKNHIIFMDRYYTGLQLLNDLKKLGIGACGTIKKNRCKLPEEIANRISSLQINETLSFKYGNLLLNCWKDSKIVMLCSNCYGNKKIESTRKKTRKNIKMEERKTSEERKADEEESNQEHNIGSHEETVDIYETVNMPIAIKEYNTYMKGVDLFDQKASNYNLNLKSYRWYLKIFFHFIEIAMVNSFVLYSKSCERDNVTPMSHMKFRMEIIRELVQGLREELGVKNTKEKQKFIGKRKPSSELINDSIKCCKLSKIPEQPLRVTARFRCGEHQNPEGQSTNRVSQTSFWCEMCKIPLCKKIVLKNILKIRIM